MTAAGELLAAVGRVVGSDTVRELSAPQGCRHSWQQVLGPEDIDGTLRDHARAVDAPADLAGVFVAEQIVAPFARLQAWALTLEGRWFDLAPEELGLFTADGRVLRAVDLTAARVAEDHDGPGAAAPLDAAVEAVVARCADAGARVPARVAASAALFAWYAALREVSSHLGGHTPAEVLESQWLSRWSVASLTRPIEVSETRTYLARAACCLEYRGDDPAERRYCTSCPMIDPAHVRERLGSAQPLSGGRRPFTQDHVGRASRGRRATS